MRSFAVGLLLVTAGCDAREPSVQVEVDLSSLLVEPTPRGSMIQGDVEVSITSSSPTEVVLDVAEATIGDERVDLEVDASMWPVAIGEAPVAVAGLSIRWERDGACLSPIVPVSVHVAVRGAGGVGAEGYFTGDVEAGPAAMTIGELFPFAWRTTGEEALPPAAWYLPSVAAASDDAVLYRVGPATLLRASEAGVTVLATNVASFARDPDGGAVALVTEPFGLAPVELRRVDAGGAVVWSVPVEGAGDGILVVAGASDRYVFVSGRAGASLRLSGGAFTPNAPFIASIDMVDGAVHRVGDESVFALVPGIEGSVLAATATFEPAAASPRGLALLDVDLQLRHASAFVPRRLASAPDGSLAALVGGAASDARVASGSLSSASFELMERETPCLQLASPGSVAALEGGGAVIAAPLYEGGTAWVRLDEEGQPSHDARTLEPVEITSSGGAVYAVWTSSAGTSTVGRIDRASIEEVLP